MNEKLLDALMELFAIIAGIEGITNKGRRVVEVFLRQWVTLDAIDKYVELFDHYIKKHEDEETVTDEEKRKRTSVRDSVKALVICQQINEHLTQEQKFVVLIRLLEFITAGKNITEAEFEFISTVALAFNVEESEFLLISDYILSDDFKYTLERGFYDVQHENVLIMNGEVNYGNKDIKHVTSDHLNGQLVFIRIKSTDIYLVKYAGEEELYLNGQVCKMEQVYLFPQGATLRSPKISPIYYSDIVSHFMTEFTSSRIVFEAKEVEYRFKSGKIGLRNINIAEDSGRLIGFMGASGAGKTTLLNVLSGIEKPNKGAVTVNGIDIHKDSKKIEGVIGYVSQDDLLIEELTVYQNLYYNAKLCFADQSEKELDALVTKTLKSLGLSDITHLAVGSPLNKKISGGQRKRLNIALELIREPSVLFLDEPTSGLSSQDSENIMDLLKELSLKGKLVFVVIHQPSSDIYKLFDRLLILDTGGFSVYYGNPIEAIIYFRKITNHVNADKSECSECGNVNPEQIFSILEAKVVDEFGNFTDKRKINPSQWYEFYLNELSATGVETIQEVPHSNLQIPSKIVQLMVFVIRDVRSKLSNLQYIIINSLEAPLLAFILAFLVRYYNTDEASGNNVYSFSENENIVAFLFMSIVVSLFMGLTVSAEEIIKDQRILKRESFLNLSRTSYLLSKLTILFSISAIQMFTYVLIGTQILEIRDMIWEYWLVLFATACFANLLGLNISASFNSAVTIYILIPVLLIPQLLLSGVIVKFDKLNPAIAADIHVPLAGDLMTSKWAFEAMAVNQFKNNKYEEQLFAFEKEMRISDFKKNYLIPKIQSKLDFCETNIDTDNDSLRGRIAVAISIAHSEISLLLGDLDQWKFENLNRLNIDSLTKKDTRAASNFLEKAKKYYIKRYNNADKLKDDHVSSLQATPELKDEYISLKKKYYNEDLATLVRNSRDPNKIIEKKGKMIQRAEPIFLDPIKHNSVLDFRSHFFAPRKNFLGMYWDTFYFNVLVIWSMVVFLYITLYFNVLKHVMNFGPYVHELVKEKMGWNKIEQED